MSGSLQGLAQRDFSGGINSVTSLYLLGEKQSALIQNMVMDEHGALKTRDGYSVATVGPGGAPVAHRAALTKVNGDNIPLAVLLQGDGNNVVYRTDTGPWTLVGGTGVGIGFPIPYSVTMNDHQVFAVGYETPWTYDGSTFTQITAAGGQTVPPGANHIAFHLGSLWVWNTNASTTVLDGPSSLRMSDPNDFNSWPNANQVFISKDDGQVGMGLASFTIAETGISPTQTLIAFKNYSAYEITGVLSSPTTFSVQKVKSDMGCIAPRTIQFVSGFGLMRLTHKGFALYNGVEDRLVSEEIRPFIFGGPLPSGVQVQGLDFTTVDRSWAVQSQNPPFYIIACPVSGTSLTRVFVYDLVRRSWTILQYPMNLTTLALITSPTTQPRIQGGTADAGPNPCSIVNMFNNDLTDDGAPISWSMRSRAFFAGSFMRPTYWRRLVLDFGFSPPQDVAVTVTTLGHNVALSRTLTYTGIAPAAIWGSSVWGSFLWGNNVLLDGRRSMDILRKGTSSFVDLSGTGHVVLRGLEWQVRSEPLNRQVR